MTKAIFPEPKQVELDGGTTKPFSHLLLTVGATSALPAEDIKEIARLRFWNYPDVLAAGADTLDLHVEAGLPDREVGRPDLFREQGYCLTIGRDRVRLRYEQRQGLINGLTTIKSLIAAEDVESGSPWVLATGEIVDYPSIPVRAVAPTFSWYAGYGRLGFDMQLWGLKEWTEYLNHCLDSKINQLNMVMYGYWPFELEQYPETVFRDVRMEIWNAENERWLKIRYSHPNIEDNYLPEFLALAHKMGVKILAYVGLNSYNGAWSIKHPEKRMTPPAGSNFLNDFDSVCLSDPENIEYILASMKRIAELGFDGFTLEESEEGFWFCECSACRERWHAHAQTPGEAKHAANLWLLQQIYDTVRAVNPEAIIGIRAFRQPPLEKDPEFLRETAATIPSDVVLFWAPALYVPETEFPKWVDAFGAERIWGRDSESNSITSTMGRLYRTFESNVLRYEDEPNVQTIERDIEQHLTSVAAGVHGINGYMFEWFGLFLHQWAHGNYGWGSTMDPDEFFKRVCGATFGDALGARVLNVMRSILTIHESQIPLYSTPFPFQSNKVRDSDLPRIEQAIVAHGPLLEEIRSIETAVRSNPRLATWGPHFARLVNAERRNRVIYDLVKAALAYERETDPTKKDALLDQVLLYNEADFAIAKEMFFDLNPVVETGVKSCMMPYHELKRIIHNIRHPEAPDNAVICSGIEALGWLWLAHEPEE